MKPWHLRTEHLDEPLGIDVRCPRFSWCLPGAAKRQEAYRLHVGRWDSDWVESDRSIMVSYAGPALSSRERVEWRVAVRTDLGVSDWSEAAWFEVGLLDPGDWHARWIEPYEPAAEREAAERPARLLRTEFNAERPVAKARLYITAHGLYEAWLNGARIGDYVLTPGFTAYHHRLQVQTYDVTTYLVAGTNCLGAVLADGWWRGRVGVFQHRNGFGDHLGLLAQLEITHDDGSTTVVCSDGTWRSATGAIVAQDLMWGETVDGARDRPGWSSPGRDVGDWAGVNETAFDLRVLCASPSPPVRRVEEVEPVATHRLAGGRLIVDFGVNLSGHVRIDGLSEDTSVTLTHGEILDGRGDVSLDHLKPPGGDLGLAPPQRDRVSGMDRFQPQFTTHGFRYVRVEGLPADVSSTRLAAVMVHTDMRRTGWFRCSDDRVNAFHDAAVRSFRSNACDIPTDCPTRERSGWTGDWQIFAPCASFLFDVAGFATKWLRDLAVEQREDGLVPSIVPILRRADGTRDEIMALLDGSAGWGDAAVLVPWAMYRAYGDERLLREQWPSMQAWVDYGLAQAREKRNPKRATERPEPLPHEKFLWDTGYHWGEWLPADKSMDEAIAEHMATVFQDGVPEVATAYLAHSAQTLSDIARVLGRREDARHYAKAAARARSAWAAEFVSATGTLTPRTQANYVRALAFRLIPDEHRKAVIGDLVRLIDEADTHLTTGFLATALLLPVLADCGQLDLAYALLLQDTEPGWLAMIGRGATTVWEHFRAVSADGVATGSLNHYSLGAVVSFLHEYVAGIRIVEPGYRRFAIAPRPGDRLTWAEAIHDSPYGRIESRWKQESGAFRLDVTVPPNTGAAVHLPDGVVHQVEPGRHSFQGISLGKEPIAKGSASSDPGKEGVR